MRPRFAGPLVYVERNARCYTHAMSKTALMVITLVLLIGAGFIVYRFTGSNASLVATSTPQETEPKLSTAEIHESTDAYVINVKYPQFGVASIDAQIRSDVDAAVKEIKDTPPIPEDSAAGENTLDGEFDSVYIGPDVISAKLVLSQYTGGAHGMTIFSGVNFDRTTGKRLTQQDAFRMIGMNVQQVSASASAQLKEKLGADVFFEEGADTNPENYSSFLVSKDKVTFIFQQYQVAPYAAGPQEVSFSRR